MIIRKPRKIEAEYGDWHFFFLPRRLGDWLVFLQWVRIKNEHLGDGRWRTTWRRPDNVIIHSHEYTAVL